MEEVVERGNRRAALRPVRAPQGSPGADDRRVDALPELLKTPWLAIKDPLLHGTSQPPGLKRGESPKPGSREQRQLGRPCGMDWRMPQATRPGLQGRGEPTFAPRRDGCRPGRSAPQAVAPAHAYIAQGYSDGVESAVEQCFDRVGQDRRMSRLAERMADKRGLKRLRACRQAGMREEGLTTRPTAGTPQGSPLSPVLSNGV
jgi:RNA-directed DNA polymerase